MSKIGGSTDSRRSHQQRLFEFEIWKNNTTLKELEYSMRRAEKQERRRAQMRNKRYKRWRKLYPPAILGMAGGAFLTLTATVQGLGANTFLWEARSILTILGPILTAIGFISLLLAAACTFRSQQDFKGTTEPSEFLLFTTERQVSNHPQKHVCQSLSINTEDMPMPEDLDPRLNFVVSKLGELQDLTNNTRKGRSDSVTSFGNQQQPQSYTSTGDWVRSVTASRDKLQGQGKRVVRHNSESNLCTSASFLERWKTLAACHSDVERPDPRNSDLLVFGTNSPSSSGYQSAGEINTGTMDSRGGVRSEKDMLCQNVTSKRFCLAESSTLTFPRLLGNGKGLARAPGFPCQVTRQSPCQPRKEESQFHRTLELQQPVTKRQRNMSEIQTNLTPLELLEYSISVESTLTSFQTPNTTHCTTIDLPAKASASDRSTFMGMTQNDRIPSPIPSECHTNTNTSTPIWENGRNSAKI